MLMSRHDNNLPPGTKIRVITSHMHKIVNGMVGVITGKGPKGSYAVKFESEQYDVALWRRDFEIVT